MINGMYVDCYDRSKKEIKFSGVVVGMGMDTDGDTAFVVLKEDGFFESVFVGYCKKGEM